MYWILSVWTHNNFSFSAGKWYVHTFTRFIEITQSFSFQRLLINWLDNHCHLNPLVPVYLRSVVSGSSFIIILIDFCFTSICTTLPLQSSASTLNTSLPFRLWLARPSFLRNLLTRASESISLTRKPRSSSGNSQAYTCSAFMCAPSKSRHAGP